MLSVDELNRLLDDREDEHLEFKEAKTQYDFGNLAKYCVALANEGGGLLVLGVTDKRPRRVVGTAAFTDIGGIKYDLLEKLHIRVEVEEVQHTHGRVLVFAVPSRPFGMALQFDGRRWMRSGGSVILMTDDVLRRVYKETGPDFSAEPCPQAKQSDLDARAIEVLRSLWVRKSGNKALTSLSPSRLLEDAGLLKAGIPSYAALILCGSEACLAKHLSLAEVVFQYHSRESAAVHQQRVEFRKGLFLFLDEVWNLVNLRNDLQHFQDGLLVWDIPTFNEVVVREAVLNAVSHRDYQLGGSVFVRQFPRRLQVVSPGGFPPGITIENVLTRQSPRNRQVAEVLQKCGLVERAGQGMDLIYGQCARESKPLPDFTGTDNYQVSLTLNGEIQHPEFLKFLERVGRETQVSFTTEDFLALDGVYREEPLPAYLKPRLKALQEQGVLESIGRGRGTRYLLSRRFYSFLGKRGTYTRKRGLDRKTQKALLLGHIKDNAGHGSPLKDLAQVLPHLSTVQVQVLLREMANAGEAHPRGRTKGARWYPGEKTRPGRGPA